MTRQINILSQFFVLILKKEIEHVYLCYSTMQLKKLRSYLGLYSTGAAGVRFFIFLKR